MPEQYKFPNLFSSMCIVQKKIQWVYVDSWLYIDWLTLTSGLSITWLVLCVAIVTRWETKEPSLPSLRTWSHSSLHTKLWWVNSARSSVRVCVCMCVCACVCVHVCVCVSVLSVGITDQRLPYQFLPHSPWLHMLPTWCCQANVTRCVAAVCGKGGLEESIMVQTAAAISLHCYIKGWRADHNTEH